MRKSRREIERALDDLGDSPDDGVGTVTIRKWRADETGEPVECVETTEYSTDADGGRDVVIKDIDIPTDWEQGREGDR